MEQKLNELIEQVRTRMIEEAMTKRNLLDQEVIELSELLDSLIYMSQLLKQDKALYEGRTVPTRMTRNVEYLSRISSRVYRNEGAESSFSFVESSRRSRNLVKRMMYHNSSPAKRRVRRRRAFQSLEQYERRSIGGMAPSMEPIRARSSRT